jgi:hypothetical protein
MFHEGILQYKNFQVLKCFELLTEVLLAASVT